MKKLLLFMAVAVMSELMQENVSIRLIM